MGIPLVNVYTMSPGHFHVSISIPYVIANNMNQWLYHNSRNSNKKSKNKDYRKKQKKKKQITDFFLKYKYRKTEIPITDIQK